MKGLMAPEQIFSIANLVALASWLMLAIFPRRRAVTHVAAGAVVPAILGTVYAVLIAATWAGSRGSFSSLAGVAELFQNPWLLLAGWIHYLAFDLLIGAWEVRDAIARRVPYVLVLPCLALTFMFGPAGWLLYLAVRSGFRPA
jgi:hypothetical protein